MWTHTIGSFVIPNDGVNDNDGNSIGYYVLAMSGVTNQDEVLPNSMQNGPDGIILFDDSDNILDAVAWEGAGDLPTDDPGTVTTASPISANNYLHVTKDDDGGDNSLQAPNNVIGDDGSGWILAVATPGLINSNQTSGNIVLPVELISFSALYVKNNVKLNWQTATEVNNFGFEIFRSDQHNNNSKNVSNIESWKNLGFINGHGNSNSIKYYSFADNNINNSGKYLYKLKQIDIDGTFEFSKIVEVNLSVPTKYQLNQNYPNPFNPTTTIKFSIPAYSHIKLSVFNVLGEVVSVLVNKSVDAGYYSAIFDASKLNSGIYFYKLENKNFTEMRKMIFIK